MLLWNQLLAGHFSVPPVSPVWLPVQAQCGCRCKPSSELHAWRCCPLAGYCDDVYGMCWCDASSKYGWKGLANGTARFSARPLGDACHPSTDKLGMPLDWGAKRYNELYGDQGWCDADVPTWHGRWALGLA